MYGGRRLAVVVPAYNEDLLIGRALDQVPRYVDQIHVVDDASTDRTAARVAGRGEARIHLHRHSTNRGAGAAIVTGYRAALAEGAELVAVMAGDAQMDPRDLPALLDALLEGAEAAAGAGYAKGNRFAWRGPESFPAARFLGGAACSWLTRWVCATPPLFDSQSGYTAITRAALQRLDLASLWPRFGYPNDLISALTVAGVPIRDVPVRPVYGAERSGITCKVVLLDLPRVLRRCARRRRTGRTGGAVECTSAS